MKFTVGLPIGVITPGEFQSARAIAKMRTALGSAGVDACYLTDHPAPSAKWLHANHYDALDLFTAIGFVAAKRDRAHCAQRRSANARWRYALQSPDP